jgi:hypothetical protein
MPVDEEGLRSFDLMHHFFKEVRGHTFNKYALPARPKIADLGAGTCIWAIETADVLKDAVVIAVDLDRTLPKWIPHGVKQIPLDLEQSQWQELPENFHLMHARMLLGSIRDGLWQTFYNNAFKYNESAGSLPISLLTHLR